LPFLFVDGGSGRVKFVESRSILIFLVYLYTCRIGVSLFLENAVSMYRRIGIGVSVSRIGAKGARAQ
jgi:hypothetical protein